MSKGNVSVGGNCPESECSDILTVNAIQRRSTNCETAVLYKTYDSHACILSPGGSSSIAIIQGNRLAVPLDGNQPNAGSRQ